MDRYLKERLVGAAVLVAAAIILIPEMLSGPHDSSAPLQESTPSADSTGTKTYTIDLSAPGGQTSRQQQDVPQTFTEVAPPHEQAESSLDSSRRDVNADEHLLDQYRTPSSTESATAEIKSQEVESARSQEKPSERIVEKPTDKPTVITAEQSDRKETDKSTPQARGGWAVQVASFEARATSDRISAELKSKGFSSFVVAFTAKGKTMYRVRVGPVEDRAAAEALLKKVKALHPQAALAPP